MQKKSLWSRLFGATVDFADAANSIAAPLEPMTPGQRSELEGLILAAQDETLESVTDGPLEQWLEQNRDPGLWHEIADGLNYAFSDNQSVLAWMLAQPDCQNAVATRIFVNAGLPALCALSGPTDGNRTGLILAHLITLRESTGGFQANRLSDATGVDRDHLLNTCHAGNRRLAGNRRIPFLPAPVRLLSARPVGPLPQTDFVIDGTTIMRVRSGA